MRKLIILLFTLSSSLCTLGQSTNVLENYSEIIEYNLIITKEKLFDGWKNFTSDTLNPTAIILDLTGDNKLDIFGCFQGISTGFQIISDINGGNPKPIFNQPFDESWFEEHVFQAVVSLIKSGQEVKSITGQTLLLKYNSVLIKKSDGAQYVLMLNGETWEIIRIN
jgi:hypothetical protein